MAKKFPRSDAGQAGATRRAIAQKTGRRIAGTGAPSQKPAATLPGRAETPSRAAFRSHWPCRRTATPG